MPINASPHFNKAQGEYLAAQTTEQKIKALKKMIALAPSHKGAENLRAQLKRRLAKLKYVKEKEEKKKSGKPGIKKEGIQVVLIGLPNSGKSSLLDKLTNASPEIAPYEFTTKEEVIGTLNYEGASFQIIDLPSITYETFNQGLTNSADILLLVITDLEQLNEITPFLEKAEGRKIMVYNKSDLLSNEEKRKLEAKMKSKKYNFVIISSKKEEGLDKLKSKLFENSGIIRIYTKEPHKEPSNQPIIMDPPVTVEEVAEKIKSGLAKKVKLARVTGPSSKFPNQQVGLKHELKDRDIVEFHTK